MQSVTRRTPRLSRHPLARGIIFCMPMQEYGGTGADNFIHDIVSKQHAVALNGPQVWKRYQYGWCMEFSGVSTTGNYLKIPRANLNWKGQVSVAMFYQPLNTPGGDSAFLDDMWGNNAAAGFQFYHRPDNKLSLHAGDTSGDDTLTTNATVSPANYPNGLILGFTASKANGNRVRSYINGVRDAEITGTRDYVNSTLNTSDFWVGANNGAFSSDNCRIGFLVIWNRELSAQEMAQFAADPTIILREPLVDGYLAGLIGQVFGQTLSETVTLTDTLLKRAGKVLNETITHTDTLLKRATKVLIETITHTDTVVAQKIAVKVLSETVTFTDTLIKQTTKVLSETITYTDTLLRRAGKTLSETITFTDTLLKQGTKVLSETITYTDTLLKRAGKVLSETITHTDTLIRRSTKVLSETITFTDTLLKQLAKTFSETITHTDTLLKRAGKVLTETITLSDTLGRIFGKVFTETVTLVDTLAADLITIVKNVKNYTMKLLFSTTTQLKTLFKTNTTLKQTKNVNTKLKLPK